MPKITKEMQELFGYTDDQVKDLKENQIQLIEKLPELSKYNLVAKVVESRNCVIGAKPGDKIVLKAGGAIDTQACTNKEEICLWAVAPLLPFSYSFHELVGHGVDPTKMMLKRVHCLDTGVEHCGWGQIVMEVRVEPRQQESI